MNCSEFDDRLNDLLDERLAPEQDLELLEHAESCYDCGQDLVVWTKASGVFGNRDGEATLTSATTHVSTKGEQRFWQSVSVIAATAAALIFVVGMLPKNEDKLVAQLVPAEAEVTASSEVSVGPMEWWESMQQQDWLAQTMPAVRTVQHGVAPLRRSFRHAVVILINHRDQAS